VPPVIRQKPREQTRSSVNDLWGSGGAVHPSAEGHAAMADAALPAVAAVLQLDAAMPEVISQPVSPMPGLPGVR
jgi:hypothetical protein